MSKLLNQYESLKKKDANCIYIFRVGIFYNILNEDAKIVNEQIGLKITDLGPTIFKCGFPVSQIDKYTKLFTEKNIRYKIIDNLPNSNVTDYLNNIEIKKIINEINDIDMNNTTFQDAFNFLLKIQNRIKKLNIGRGE